MWSNFSRDSSTSRRSRLGNQACRPGRPCRPSGRNNTGVSTTHNCPSPPRSVLRAEDEAEHEGALAPPLIPSKLDTFQLVLHYPLTSFGLLRETPWWCHRWLEQTAVLPVHNLDVRVTTSWLKTNKTTLVFRCGGAAVVLNFWSLRNHCCFLIELPTKLIPQKLKR